MKIEPPYYATVPKDIAANLAFRRRLNQLGHDNRHAAQEMWRMCSRDLLFFINAFGWVFDPLTPADRPFVTWPFQDDYLVSLSQAIGKIDVGVEKSREMGASWGMLIVFLWYFLFRDKQTFLLVSAKQDLVDKAENPDALFWKLDYMRDKLPTWMQPSVNRVLLHMKNLENQSVIDGTSTTGDIGRSGRRLAVGMDEFASFPADDGYAAFAATQAVTACRMFVSTPKGGTGAYYDVMHDEQSEMVRLRLHWSKHPMKRPGLYTADDGKLRIIDETYRFPDRYPFVLDGKLRSPWYDRESRRPGATPQLMAQEHDIEYLGSDDPFFEGRQLDKVQARDCRPPLLVGELLFEEDGCRPLRFEKQPRGELRLWIPLAGGGRPARDRHYVAGADISAGTGASNSCLSVVDRGTGEKVAEFVTPHRTPERFARACVALCRWFVGLDEEEDGCLLIWEANGPGRQFEKAVQRADYWHIFWRSASIGEKRVSRRVTDIPGFWKTTETTKILLGGYREALIAGWFRNPSTEAIDEARRFIYTKTGEICHSSSLATQDPSGARLNHGDRVIADALCCKVLTDRRQKAAEQPKQTPVNCFLWRRRRRKLQKNICELRGW